MTYFHRFIICSLAILVALAIIHYNNLDLKFQSLFFDFENKSWLVNRGDLILKFFFYKLPKYLIVIYGMTILFKLINLRVWGESLELQKKLLFLISVLILTPLIVALFKHYSPIYCPNFIEEFYGDKAYISTFDMFNPDIFFNNAGKCFPAGHASGGFSLISLYFVVPSRFKVKALVFSIFFGSIMGFYQIAKGTHYLSDTITTLGIAYLICITMYKIIFENKK